MTDWTGRFDDPSYLSPLAEELNAGYMRFSHLDDGSSYEMMKPGAVGFGLHVGNLFAPDCCCGYYSTISDVAVYKDEYNPWLFPSIVTWQSIMMPNRQPHPDYVRNFSVDYPVVAITHVRSSIDDFRWAINNLNYEGDTNRFSYEPNDDPIKIAGTEIIGVVPIWAVTPLFNEEKKMDVNQLVHRLTTETNLSLFSECWCTIDGMQCDEDCDRQTDYSQECSCLAQERLGAEIEKLYNEPLKVEDYLDKNTKKIWDYAVGRFYDGWQVVHDTSHLGEQWASYWRQAQSPFSALPGQNFRDLLESTNSINSATQQAS
jgi:hypothetical protein